MTAESILPDNDPLAAALASLTDWREADESRPTLAAAALAASRPRRSLRLMPSMPRTFRFASIAALLIVGICLAAFLSPSLGRARHAPVASEAADRRDYIDAPEFDLQSTLATGRAKGTYGYAGQSPGPGLKKLDAAAPDAAKAIFEKDVQGKGVSLQDVHQPAEQSIARSVIRKSSIDLKVADIRAVFSKIALIPSQAQGEYTESADLSGSPTPTGASIVLRVRADRLSAVLNELRAFGEVTTESSKGEDVTDQAVDLDARPATNSTSRPNCSAFSIRARTRP
jgi:hypothetical protein